MRRDRGKSRVDVVTVTGKGKGRECLILGLGKRIEEGEGGAFFPSKFSRDLCQGHRGEVR